MVAEVVQKKICVRQVVIKLVQANQIVQQILAVVKHFQDVRLDIMKIRTIVVLFHMEVIL